MPNTRARKLRNNMTEAEKKLWYRLRLRQIRGCKFRRQMPIGDYVVDFVCLEKRLIIEVDGGHHAEQKENDRKREDWLRVQGFQIKRFWNNEVLSETDPPTLTLPLKGGGN